jgi:hypothetical protein
MAQRSRRGAVRNPEPIGSWFSKVLQWLNRPMVWLVGVPSTIATTLALSFYNETLKPSLDEAYCEFRRERIIQADDKLAILVSPLLDDPGGSQIHRE